MQAMATGLLTLCHVTVGMLNFMELEPYSRSIAYLLYVRIVLDRSEKASQRSNVGTIKSCAYQTSRTRWPKIYSSATINRSKPPYQDEIAGKINITKFATLKNTVASNAPLDTVADDGSPDMEEY